ncbi:DUF6378 domain-containing protein [Mycobacteroides chelonae]|uniref:DUF6378 domain-containing protein n=1 Tax=Mycobacteroides chelonae TaxID=1774 RepID=UPI0004AABF02|nr:DUF6378 domain-containing protein [Mycobacteroides chelonae]OHT67801.1 hypothetical protein BKG66_24560 [Mycobacteroides chelonae]OHT69444.1 hypothetical protein BKG67_23095 [Mycobacteroides chelonae]
MTETVLQEAERIINGARQESYGPPEQSLGAIAELWSPYLKLDLSARDVANLMILLKVARSKQGFHRDSYVDIAGYAGLTEKLSVEPGRPTPRQWNTLLSIPRGVKKVTTPSRVIWRYFPDQVALREFGRWCWSVPKGYAGSGYNVGPFTEVLGDA